METATILKGCEKAMEFQERCSQPYRVVTSFLNVVNWLPNSKYILKVTCRAKRIRFISIITRVFETSNDVEKS